MKRIALGISYLGHGFSGWQSQTNQSGVQDTLERAIKQVAGHTVRVHAAGRTDTGVHALAQVVHVDTHAVRPISAWVRGVNAFLPPSVRITWAHEVAPEFHARFSAISRSYQYLLYNAPVASAIMHHQCGWFHLPLNVEAMQKACTFLLGEHDFSAFRASACQAKSPIKTMHEAQVKQHGAYIVFSFSANAFLHHQVRNMVGALVYVGKGTLQSQDMQMLLQQKNRTLAPPTFSPNGLYFVGVEYDSKWALPNDKIATEILNWLI